MQRLRRNQGGYRGEPVDIDALQAGLLDAAETAGWSRETREAAPGRILHFLHRPSGIPGARRIYLSSGIHGDEPAGPCAVRDLITGDLLPRDADLWVCPCLNPTGYSRNDRHNADGLDLNRDYNHLRSPEVRTHTGWLEGLPRLDLALLLHEDWEADGFYLYELNPEGGRSVAHGIVEAVAPVCPIEKAEVVDGRPAAAPGIIRPPTDPTARPDWPEAFWLHRHRGPLSYTLESPSDFPLQVRVDALVRAVGTAIRLHGGSENAA